jgi:hypothetical protein
MQIEGGRIEKRRHEHWGMQRLKEGRRKKVEKGRKKTYSTLLLLRNIMSTSLKATKNNFTDFS